MDYPQRRLLLYALVKGLGDAVRRNDGSAAERYRGRLRLVAEQFDANPPIREALEKLLSVSGLWLATNIADRDETKEQMLELIERVMELLVKCKLAPSRIVHFSRRHRLPPRVLVVSQIVLVPLNFRSRFRPACPIRADLGRCTHKSRLVMSALQSDIT